MTVKKKNLMDKLLPYFLQHRFDTMISLETAVRYLERSAIFDSLLKSYYFLKAILRGILKSIFIRDQEKFKKETSLGFVYETIFHLVDKEISEQIKAPKIQRMWPLLLDWQMATCIDSIKGNMVVIYLISIWEAFNRDLFKLFYKVRKQCYGSEKAHRFSGNSPEDIRKHFILAYQIDIKDKIKCWAVLHEGYHRRHTIVHNQNIADEQYRCKVDNVKLGEKLETNRKYIKSLLNGIIEWVNIITVILLLEFMSEGRKELNVDETLQGEGFNFDEILGKFKIKS